VANELAAAASSTRQDDSRRLHTPTRHTCTRPPSSSLGGRSKLGHMLMSRPTGGEVCLCWPDYDGRRAIKTNNRRRRRQRPAAAKRRPSRRQPQLSDRRRPLAVLVPFVARGAPNWMRIFRAKRPALSDRHRPMIVASRPIWASSRRRAKQSAPRRRSFAFLAAIMQAAGASSSRRRRQTIRRPDCVVVGDSRQEGKSDCRGAAHHHHHRRRRRRSTSMAAGDPLAAGAMIGSLGGRTDARTCCGRRASSPSRRMRPAPVCQLPIDDEQPTTTTAACHRRLSDEPA
jgi:hypothetical protein